MVQKAKELKDPKRRKIEEGSSSKVAPRKRKETRMETLVASEESSPKRQKKIRFLIKKPIRRQQTLEKVQSPKEPIVPKMVPSLEALKKRAQAKCWRYRAHGCRNPSNLEYRHRCISWCSRRVGGWGITRGRKCAWHMRSSRRRRWRWWWWW